MEGGGGAGRERGRGFLPTVSLGFFFFSQVVLISGAHVYQSMNQRLCSAQSQLAYLLFMLTVIFCFRKKIIFVS